MIRALAIDDEPLALQQLATYIRRIPYMELAGECQSALDAYAVLRREPIDVIFCDINMPDLNGIDFVRSLDIKPLVVFTTAYSQYALDGYKVNAIDYLIKPFSLGDFKKAAEKVRHHYELLQKQTIASQIDEDSAIFFKTEYKVVRVEVADIRCVEGMSEYLKMHIVNSDRPVVVLMGLKKLEDRLRRESFMRVHRSWIVNLRRICEVAKSRILLDNDMEIPIGDLYREQFMAYIESKFVGR